MGPWVVRALRTVIVIALAGSIVVQLVLVAALWTETGGAPDGIDVALAAIGVLGVGALQVIGLCVWRLLTMARRGTVFSAAAFRYVDVVIGALVAGSVLVLGVAVVATSANHAEPGDAVAPGVVGFICGLALVVAGFALVVYVLRTLLAQAVALDAETRHLRSELDEVI